MPELKLADFIYHFRQEPIRNKAIAYIDFQSIMMTPPVVERTIDDFCHHNLIILFLTSCH